MWVSPPPFTVCLLVFRLEPPFPLHPLILARSHKTEKQRVTRMECGRLSGGLWMSRHIFKVWFQLISLPAKVHLNVVGGVKRGCGGRESINATGQTCRTVILTTHVQHPAVQHQEQQIEESSVFACARAEGKNQASSKMAPSDRRRRDKSSVPTELGWRKKRGNKSEASRERSL